ncbi:MAG: hypothetical protein QOJ04_4994 [Caballeronia sp.]|jgi:hypothetical protein|nr:hypothetical protein [Caballeronia sp.]
MDDPRAYFKRIASTDFRLRKSTVFYECSTELQILLAALTEESAAEIAEDWYGIKVPPNNPKPLEPNGRAQRRQAMLNELATLAKQATVGQKLMLRVEYRKQR